MAERKKTGGRKAKSTKRPRSKPTKAERERARGKGPRHPPAEQVKRDGDIFRAWLRGVDVADLAQLHGISADRIYAIVSEQKRQARELLKADPLEIIEEWIQKNRANISNLATVEAREKGQARVAAIRLKADLQHRELEVLQSVGILPHDLGTLRVHLNVIQAAARLIEILDEEDALTPRILERIQNEWAQTFEQGSVDGEARELPSPA